MPLRPAPRPAPAEIATLIESALASHPRRREASVQLETAENARRLAQALWWPSVNAHGSWTLNGSTFTDQQSSWIVGADVRVNVFRGFADRARLAQAGAARQRALAERERIERRIELDVRATVARLAAARARDAAGRAALIQARESQRIIRDRYESGLATITDVLRAAESALDAESRAMAAEMDLVLQSVALDRAVGRL